MLEVVTDVKQEWCKPSGEKQKTKHHGDNHPTFKFQAGGRGVSLFKIILSTNSQN